MKAVAIDLIGAAALLLWGLRMVRTGVNRAFGARLRHALSGATRNRVVAFAAGLSTTLVLQSSTATALMTGSFASRGFMTTAMALAVMLGADVGTALVAQVLAFDLHWLSPLLIALGVASFLSADQGPRRAVGRTLTGLGLMLLALKLLVGASVPLRDSSVAQALFAALNAAPVLGMMVAAAVTLLTTSSLAMILLIVSLAANGVVAPALAVALVLGANAGGALVPVLAHAAAGPVARRAPLGNAGMRLAGALLVLPFAEPVATVLSGWASDAGRLVVDVHLLFNLALACVFLPFVALIGRWLDAWLPAPAAPEQGPRYLDEASLESPAIALSCAARETLRIGDRIDAMLQASIVALRSDDQKLCAEIGRMDDEVDRLQEAVKLYLSRLGREGLDDADGKRATEIISFAINLEHVGDVIDKSLRELIAKKLKHKLAFSAEGQAEIETLHARTRDNLHLAQSIFVSRDEKLARRLIQEKVGVRQIEQQSADRHLERLRHGRIESLQTSTLHLDIMRDLKRINAHIASVAYPVLAETGALQDSRLKDEFEVDPADARSPLA